MTPQEIRLQRREERTHEWDATEHLGPQFDSHHTKADEFGKCWTLNPSIHNGTLVEDENGDFWTHNPTDPTERTPVFMYA